MSGLYLSNKFDLLKCRTRPLHTVNRNLGLPYGYYAQTVVNSGYIFQFTQETLLRPRCDEFLQNLEEMRKLANLSQHFQVFRNRNHLHSCHC